jgi:uncharacterized protein (TIGR02678 family)
MRRLLELPALLYADLTDAEASYLTSQRSRLLSWCTQMTGWAVELRREGIALIVTDENETDLEFPRNKTLDFLAINILDVLLRQFPTGSAFTESAVRRAAADVRGRYPRAQTKEISSDVQAARKSIEVLSALDLIRPGEAEDTWTLMPPAHRYRNPKVDTVGAQLDLENDE